MFVPLSPLDPDFINRLEDAYNEAGTFIDYFDIDDPDQDPLPGFEGEYFDGCGNCIARVVGGRVWPVIMEHLEALEAQMTATT